MRPVQPGRFFAAAVVLVVAAAAARWLLEVTQPLRHPVGAGYDDLLGGLAAWVLLGCAAWATAIGAAAVVEVASAGSLPATAWMGCPPALRRLLLAGLGFVLVGAGPVHAPATASAEPQLPVPARPVGTVSADSKPGLVVHPGDTLWRLAADRLRPSAAPTEVAALVQDLHLRNRGVIGPDPDLIRPGQRLAVPPPINRSQLTHPSAGRQEETP